MDGTHRINRLEARAVACPACGAAPQERCVGARGQPRESNHLARVSVVRVMKLGEDPAPLLRDAARPAVVAAPEEGAHEGWLGVACPRRTCGAPPAQRCRDRGGRVRERPHAARLRRAAALLRGGTA
jgi:hypothetical protein